MITKTPLSSFTTEELATELQNRTKTLKDYSSQALLAELASRIIKNLAIAPHQLKPCLVCEQWKTTQLKVKPVGKKPKTH